MLIWKAKAAKSTGVLKSVSVHQFDNTFTMKTSNCKAFSIDTRLQLRLQGLRKFRLFLFLQEVEKTSTVQYFFETATVFTAAAPSQKLVSYPTLADTLLPYDTAIYSFFFIVADWRSKFPTALSAPVSLSVVPCVEKSVLRRSLVLRVESIKRRKSSCSL